MYKLIFAVLLYVLSNPAFSGDAENISTCVNKANEFAGVVLDSFAVKYEGNIMSYSTAK